MSINITEIKYQRLEIEMAKLQRAYHRRVDDIARWQEIARKLHLVLSCRGTDPLLELARELAMKHYEEQLKNESNKTNLERLGG